MQVYLKNLPRIRWMGYRKKKKKVCKYIAAMWKITDILKKYQVKVTLKSPRKSPVFDLICSYFISELWINHCVESFKSK